MLAKQINHALRCTLHAGSELTLDATRHVLVLAQMVEAHNLSAQDAELLSGSGCFINQQKHITVVLPYDLLDDVSYLLIDCAEERAAFDVAVQARQGFVYLVFEF